MLELPTESKGFTYENPLPIDHPSYPHFEKIYQRLQAVDEYQKLQPSEPGLMIISECQNSLVSLIGPENAAPLLNLLSLLSKSVSTIGSDSPKEKLYEKYMEYVELLEAFLRMIDLMVKTYDSGEAIVQNIQQFGDLQGINLVNAVVNQLERDLVEARKNSFDYAASDGQIPPSLLDDIRWSFQGFQYSSRAEFDKDLHQSRLKFGIRGFYDPWLIALHSPSIRIEISDWMNEDDCNHTIEFSSDNGLWFTEGELLFKIHNALVEQCNESEHHYFEGLDLHDIQEQGKSPLYSINLT